MLFTTDITWKGVGWLQTCYSANKSALWRSPPAKYVFLWVWSVTGMHKGVLQTHTAGWTCSHKRKHYFGSQQHISIFFLFFIDHKFSCVETVKYKFDSGAWYVWTFQYRHIYLTLSVHMFLPHLFASSGVYRLTTPPHTHALTHPQPYSDLTSLALRIDYSNKENHKCVIKAVQLCHQVLTWLSSSRAPNPAVLRQPEARHLDNPLTFNHGSVLPC